jgi:hypothetical protein
MLQAEVPRAERLTRFSYDSPLIAVFMDHWRPETHTHTHTFHYPVGETQSGGRRDVGMTVVCWRGDGADRHPRDVAHRLIPCSVRERSSERSRASAVRALR